jgi:protein involved in sex pheromone biosynthesis
MNGITVDHKRKIMNRTMSLILLLGMIIFLTACAAKTKVQEEDTASLQAKWTKEVSKIIKDPVRAEKVISLGVQYEGKARALLLELEKLAQELNGINQNYDSTSEDYQQTLGEFNEKRDEAIRQYLDSLFAMRQQTTAEEWKTLTR